MSGLPSGNAASVTDATALTYVNSRWVGSSASTYECRTPSRTSVRPPRGRGRRRPPRSGTASRRRSRPAPPRRPGHPPPGPAPGRARRRSGRAGASRQDRRDHQQRTESEQDAAHRQTRQQHEAGQDRADDRPHRADAGQPADDRARLGEAGEPHLRHQRRHRGQQRARHQDRQRRDQDQQRPRPLRDAAQDGRCEGHDRARDAERGARSRSGSTWSAMRPPSHEPSAIAVRAMPITSVLVSRVSPGTGPAGAGRRSRRPAPRPRPRTPALRRYGPQSGAAARTLGDGRGRQSGHGRHPCTRAATGMPPCARPSQTTSAGRPRSRPSGNSTPDKEVTGVLLAGAAGEVSGGPGAPGRRVRLRPPSRTA